MSHKCKDLVRQANSSRIKHAYNALVEIRKSYLKTNSIQSLIDANLVPRLVQLIRTWESIEDGYRTRVVDVTTSVLANMCMESNAREKVLKADGVTALGDLFMETNVESFMNRSCRCLANMLLSPRSWEPVHGLGIHEKLAKVLNETEDDDCKQTYIRAVRLLGQTPKHVGLLLENNLVTAVSKHIDAENSGVKQAALRCLQSLTCHGCTEQFARQVAKSGKLEYLLDLVQELNHEVFKIVCKLAAHETFRPEFGNMGGIASFIEYFKSEDPAFRELRIEVLNVLCLCCKDSVNRVKLRENGALQIFVDSLSDDSFKVLHERLVSALVCFLYDKQSFESLLDKGMVEVLFGKFKRYMAWYLDTVPVEESSKDTTIADIELEEDNKQMEDDISAEERNKKEDQQLRGKEGNTETKFSVEARPQIRVQSEEYELELSTKKKNNEGEGDVPISLSSEEYNRAERISTEEQEDANQKSTSEELANCYELQREEVQNNRPKYSINSPTYETVSIEQQEDYTQGPKCKESFTPPHITAGNISASYSPLSNCSYNSPSGSSPEYCPESSSHRNCSADAVRNLTNSYRSMSPTEYSPEHRQPKYTGFTRSPDSSPERSTSQTEIAKSGPIDLRWSSKEIRRQVQPLSPNQLSRISETDSVFDNEEYQYSPVMSTQDFEENEATEVIDENARDRKADVQAEHAQATDNSSLTLPSPAIKMLNTEQSSNAMKKTKINKSKDKALKLRNDINRKRKHQKSQNTSFEDNFLILISRVQVVSPIKHMISLDMINYLFDYLSEMDQPLTRAARVLSRFFRNKLCFEKLITLRVPILIYNKLLHSRDYSEIVSSLLSRKHGSSSKRFWSVMSEEDQDSTSTYDRFSMADDTDIAVGRQSCKRFKLGHCESSKQQSRESKDIYLHHICHVEKCGVAFLDDLTSVAETAYGRGVIDRILITCSEEMGQEICMCIPFIIQSIDARKYYLTQLNILDQLFAVLENKDNLAGGCEEIFTIVNGLSIMAKMSRINTKYHLPYSICTDDEAGAEDVCMVKSNSDRQDADTVFVVEGERILINRDKLTEKSDFFAAMLKGGYKEADMTEIPLPETDKFSLKYIIHYTYACGSECPVLAYLDTAEVSMISLKHCISLLMELDKHLLTEFRNFIITNKLGRFLIPEGFYLIFEYAVIAENEKLQRSAVACLLGDGTSEIIQQLVIKIMGSKYSQIFLDTIQEVLTE